MFQEAYKQYQDALDYFMMVCGIYGYVGCMASKLTTGNEMYASGGARVLAAQC